MRKKISLLLALFLILPNLIPFQFAGGVSSNVSYAVGEEAENKEIGKMNAFDALGIDTTLMPEGYDEYSKENPYGRNKVIINPVYELFITGRDDHGLTEKLYGHNKPLNQGMGKFYESPMITTLQFTPTPTQTNTPTPTQTQTQTQENEPTSTPTNSATVEATNTPDVSPTQEASLLPSPTNIPVISIADFAASASASGNFVTSSVYGTAGQVVTVGVGNLSTNGGLYMYFNNPVTGEKSSETKVLLGTDKNIGNAQKDSFSESPYQMQNYLQVTTGNYDKDDDNINEIAVYVPEKGNSRVEIYKLQVSSSAKENAYLDVNNWKKEWTYYFNESPLVSNMVSLTTGDFNRDGTDDIVLSWGYYYGKDDNSSSQAVVLYGDRYNMFQKRKSIDLNYDTSKIVRAAFTYGDIDGDNVNDMILGGQASSDIANGNLNTRFIGVYTYDGNSDEFIQVIAKNFNLFERDENGNYVYSAMSANNDKYYSLPGTKANISAVKMEGMGDSACIYLDSILYELGDEGLGIKKPLDQDSKFNGVFKGDIIENFFGYGITRYYVEYDAESGDFTGNSRESLQTMQY